MNNNKALALEIGLLLVLSSLFFIVEGHAQVPEQQQLQQVQTDTSMLKMALFAMIGQANITRVDIPGNTSMMIQLEHPGGPEPTTPPFNATIILSGVGGNVLGFGPETRIENNILYTPDGQAVELLVDK
jgi:hypothetical protein